MIVVTGGAGFIGSNLVRGLNARGIHDILVVDDFEDGSKHLNLNACRFADLMDYRDFRQGLWDLADSGVEAVFHQGACSDTTERDGRFMLEVNYEYSKELCAFCTEHDARFIYASSAATYGDGKRGFREEPECEWPLNVYGFSKMVFDQWVRAQGRSATQIAGLRYFNVYGPQENHKGRMASVVYHFHKQIGEHGELKIFEGSEGFVRDFVHVDDVVAVNLWLYDHPQVSGIFNCGTGKPESFRKLAEETARHYAGARIATIPFPADLAGKYQAYTCADLAKLRAAGYGGAFRGLGEGVASYVKILKESGGHHRAGA
ncbi:MAG: ADP-glyceromanno-heptose 6-epimerase [Planctomycetota bacterium]|nr:MAG: ADP-glyceromanno-heptose 6-epimerase [Planctomycetota bacterium]